MAACGPSPILTSVHVHNENVPALHMSCIRSDVGEAGEILDLVVKLDCGEMERISVTLVITAMPWEIFFLFLNTTVDYR